MKKAITLCLLSILLVSRSLFAQIPIVYYDFESNSSRGTFENAVEMSVNTPPGGSAFTYTTSAAGACNSIDCSNAAGKEGAGQENGGTATGSSLTVGAWNQATVDPGTGSPSRYQFVVNSAGFTGISLTFDTKYGNNNAPTSVGVLISNNGTTWTFVGSSATPNGNTIPVKPGNNLWSVTTAKFNLTAASSAIADNNSTLYIRIYGYEATGGGASAYLSLDNVTILATGTVAGKVFTTMDESNYYTCYTSGLTGATLGRDNFSASGSGTNVSINTGSGLKLNSGKTFSLSTSALLTLGASGAISGTGGIFNIASGCTVVTANTGGIPSGITTTGANTFAAGANYTFNAATSTPFPVAGLGSPGNVTINPGAANTVTLNVSTAISGVLAFTAGKLAIANNTLAINGTVTGNSATNYITGGINSNLSIGGSGALGSLFFNQTTDGTTNNIATLTLNRSTSGSFSLGNKLVSGAACNLVAGKLIMNSQTLVLNGTFSGSASAYLTGSTTSALNIGGSGSLGTLFFDQATPGITNSVASFTLNRSSTGTATMGNAISIGTGGLNLLNGTLADGGNIVTLAGSITGSGGHGGSGKISMVGSGTSVSGASLGNLELNNASGFTLSGSPSIGGTLGLVSGKLTLGANNLVLGLAAAISGLPSASSMIVANSTGQVRKLFSSNGSFLFPIGDNTNYTPISVNFTSGTYTVGAYCAAAVKTVKHPSNVNVTDYINRYWPITTSGITSPVYNIVAATYVPGDVAGTEANISMGQYAGILPWVKFGSTNTTTHTLSSTSVSNPNCDFTGISTAAAALTTSPDVSICPGGNTTLSVTGSGDPTLTYSWSPAAGLSATVGTSVTASPTVATNYTVTATDGNGFTSSAVIAVSITTILPFSGNTVICAGATNTLTYPVTGGTWISGNTAVATAGLTTGDITGVGAGTCDITYNLSSGCVIPVAVTVLPLPASIGGNASVCTGLTTSLSHSVSSGTWASSNITVATVASSGLVTGVSAGTANITYTLPSGCFATRQVTVQPVPAAISGSDNVCVGNTTTLSHVSGGGFWVSSDPSKATINSSGVVTGVAQGTAVITYTVLAGCTTTFNFSVNPLPSAITGIATVCENAGITLSDVDAGGNWSCFPFSIASINSSGLVTGVAPGTATVIYSLPTGCTTTRIVTVNAAPPALGGATEVCVGATAFVTNALAGGTWGSGATGIASVSTTGEITGIMPGVAPVSYTIANGCSATIDVTVNPLPGAITGDHDFCLGQTVSFVNGAAAGIWGCIGTSGAGITPGGAFTSPVAGTNTITYTLPTGCYVTTVVTIYALPAAVVGPDQLCLFNTATFTDATPGGTWSSSVPATASISSMGLLTALAEGTTDIVYTSVVGCSQSLSLTVNPSPAPISGTTNLCVGATGLLSNAVAGGTWESSTPAVLSINVSGVISGLSSGTSVVSYTLPTGCFGTTTVSVNALPAAISAPSGICVNSTATLTNADAGGTWSGTNSFINVVAGSGLVTGLSAGMANVTYTLATGCKITTSLIINDIPPTIFGPSTVCEGQSITLANALATGTWSSAAANVTVGAGTGVVNAVSSGTAVITYSIPTGCFITKEITVNALPAAFADPMNICSGQAATLTGMPTGGTWSGSDDAVATLTTSGAVTAVSTGNLTITYTLATGCKLSAAFSVDPLPAAITGPDVTCVNQSIALAVASVGGSWSSNDPTIADILSSGIATGHAMGIATIAYTLPTGCASTHIVSVNPLPEAISGASSVCLGQSQSLSSLSAGGVWSSSDPLTASIDATGLVSGSLVGPVAISYTLGTGCFVSLDFSVNQLPAAITGSPDICMGSTASLMSAPIGGSWSTGAAAILTINTSTGLMAGLDQGTANVTYTLPTGCTTARVQTVNPLPVAITGAAIACVGESSLLENSDIGGTWSSGSTGIAIVDASGNVTGIAGGNGYITYTLPTGCNSSRQFTVNALPASFTGLLQVCEGLTTTLTNSTTGGTWSVDDASVATINSSTGLVSGIVVGNTHITYTLPTGCYRSQVMTVNPAVPDITGSLSVCLGQTSALSNPIPGGTWTSSNLTYASVGLSSGIVSGINIGTARLTYILPTGCKTTGVATINSLPAAISGAHYICAGLSVTLSNTTVGGTWGGGLSGIASISVGGIVSGIAAGSASFTYMLASGCFRTANIDVLPLPAAETVTGGGDYCAGGAGVHIGLAASASATTYRLYNGTSLSGVVSGSGGAIDFGTYSVAGIYTVKATTTATGCINTMAGDAVVTILPLVVPSVAMLSDHGDTVCSGVLATFSALTVNGGTTPAFEWFVNNTLVGTGAGYGYIPIDGDSVKVHLLSSEACPSPAVVIAKKKVRVVETHLPTIGITRTSTDPDCQYSLATFHAVPAWQGPSPVYTWKRNGSDIASGIDLSYIPSDGDVITCKLTSNYRCRLADDVTSDGITLTVDSAFIPSISITAYPGAVIAPLATATLTATVTDAGPDPAYQWSLNGAVIPGATSMNYMSTFNDNDEVSCRVLGSGPCGLPSFNLITIEVSKYAGFETPHFASSDIKLSPNPTTGSLSLQGNHGTTETGTAMLEVTNMLGQVVYNNRITAINGVIDEKISLENTLSDGVYMFSVTSGSDRKVMHFILKK